MPHIKDDQGIFILNRNVRGLENLRMVIKQQYLVPINEPGIPLQAA